MWVVLRQIYNFIPFFAMLMSCDFNESQDIYIKEIMRQDYLTVEDTEIILTKITGIKKINNHILVIDGPELKFYITDPSLNVLEYHDLTEWNYLFFGEIEDIAYFDGKYFIIDHSMNLKIYDPLSEIIRTEQFVKSDNRVGRFTSIDIINDSVLVAGLWTSYLPKDIPADDRIFDMYPSDDSLVPVGMLYHINGEILETLYIPYGLLSHTKTYEFSYVKYFNNSIYICFSVSPTILVFGKNGSLQYKYEINYPGFIHPKTLHRQRIFTVFRDRITTRNELNYYFVNRGVNDQVRIFVYDSDFKNIMITIHIEDILPGTVYSIVLIDEYLLLAGSHPFDPNYIYVYDASGI